MVLAIDFGNSRIKLGIFEEDQLIYFWSWQKWDHVEWRKIIRRYAPSKIMVCTVVTLSSELKNLSQKHAATILNDGHFSFIKNHYKTKNTLGIDRLTGLVGAYALFPAKNILVISAGTCITYDVLTKDREYFGGNISPGLDMRLKAMHEFTSKLPVVKKEPSGELFGNDTRSSMLTGALSGAVFEMQGFIQAYQKKYHSLKVILTGGDASFFDAPLKSETFAIPNLVLMGLNEMAKLNDD